MLLRNLSKSLFSNPVFQTHFYALNPYSFGTIKKFHLPDLGEKIKEATIKKWHVKEGDIVEEYQPLADVATDKLFTQIPASESGKIHKRCYKEEEACQVGDVLLEIEVDDSAGAKTEAPKQQSAAPPQGEKVVAHSIETGHKSSGKLSTPAVRAIAREHKIDINLIHGTGKDGRVMKEDILAYMQGGKKHETHAKHQDHHAKAHKAEHHESTHKRTHMYEVDLVVIFRGSTAPLSKKSIPMSDFQKGMQKSMSEALLIPHFNYKDEFDITKLADLREKVKKDANLKITFMPFFLKALSMALGEFPIINSWYNKEKQFEYTLVENHNISFAIDSPKGLVVPNIKNCQDKSIFDINEEMNRIIGDAQKGTLGPKDLMDGTFSVSNIGNIGGTYLGPVILAPQVAIVALGKSMLLPRYHADEKGGLHLVPRKIMNVSFGCDHRVLDGATVARFSQKWKGYLENPETMILHMK